MWQVVGQVSSIFALLAFAVTALATVWRRALLSREKLIATASKEERGRLAAAVLDRVAVDTSRLAPSEQLALAREILRGRAERFRWTVLSGLVLFGLSGLLGAYALMVFPRLSAQSYRLRVTVVDSEGRPVEGATVRSSVGGEIKGALGGWEIEIPASSRPIDGRLRVLGDKGSQHGSAEVLLEKERLISVLLRLAMAPPGEVRGTVLDPANRAVGGARVSVLGYGEEAALTKVDGGFVLPAHLASGEEVRLHVEHPDFRPKDLYHVVGSAPAVIVLEPP